MPSEQLLQKILNLLGNMRSELPGDTSFAQLYDVLSALKTRLDILTEKLDKLIAILSSAQKQ